MALPLALSDAQRNPDDQEQADFLGATLSVYAKGDAPLFGAGCRVENQMNANLTKQGEPVGPSCWPPGMKFGIKL
jgi:hypothetical protein